MKIPRPRTFLWEYPALVERVVDGDTVALTLDLGLHTFVSETCRLAGINAPELNSADPLEREKAVAARDWLAGTLATARMDGYLVLALSKGLDKWRRPLVELWLTTTSGDVDRESLNARMVAAGHATPYVA